MQFTYNADEAGGLGFPILLVVYGRMEESNIHFDKSGADYTLVISKEGNALSTEGPLAFTAPISSQMGCGKSLSPFCYVQT